MGSGVSTFPHLGQNDGFGPTGDSGTVEGMLDPVRVSSSVCIVCDLPVPTVRQPLTSIVPLSSVARGSPLDHDGTGEPLSRWKPVGEGETQSQWSRHFTLLTRYRGPPGETETK